MAIPVITWRQADNSADLPSLELGTIDAGTASIAQSTKTILIWNNHAGVTDVADAYDCYIGAVDTTGSTVGDNVPQLITQCFTKIKDVGNGATEFSPVGYDEAAVDKIRRVHVCANGTTTNGDGSFVASPAGIGGDTNFANPILGRKNAGLVADAGNFAKIDFALELPPTANSGSYSFMLKFWYTHI